MNDRFYVNRYLLKSHFRSVFPDAIVPMGRGIDHQGEMLMRLVRHLLSTNQVRSARPNEIIDDDSHMRPGFVLEKMVATKLVVPEIVLLRTPGVRSLNVWVSEPDETVWTAEEYIWRGTFLYLTEAHWDNKVSRITWSGCSALQCLVNLFSGKSWNTLDREEPLGRWCSKHPVEKLKQLGAIESMPKEIVSLYQMRYMTNEQCYKVKGKKRRVHDLLGYPIGMWNAVE